MNTASASRAEPAAEDGTRRQVLVWDLPVRVFHWLMALSFAGAWITAESERWRLLHVTLGYTMAGLVAFRLVWGLIGTRHARFASFVRGPDAVVRYLRSLPGPRPEHHVGHNPAGAWAIVMLLLLAAGIVASGWATYSELGGDALADVHEAAATLMMMAAGVHVAGVAVSSWLHRENLVRSMITGRKAGRPEDGVRRAWHSVAALLLAGVLSLWWLQWQSAPSGSGLDAARHASHSHVDSDDD